MNPGFDIGNTHLVGIPQHRDDQSPFRGYGDADILIAVIDDIATIDGGIDCGKALQGLHRHLDEKPHKTQPGAAVYLGKLVLVLLAQIHDSVHIHLVEGGQHGGVLAHIQQALGDTGPHPGHGYPLFDAVPGGGPHLLDFVQAFRRRCRGGRCRPGSRLGGDVEIDNVFLGDAAAASGPLNLAQVDAFLVRQLAGRRAGYRFLL